MKKNKPILKLEDFIVKRDEIRKLREIYFLQRIFLILLVSIILLIIFYKNKKMTKRIFWFFFSIIIISIFKIDFVPINENDYN